MDSDEQLIMRAAEGDLDAFGQLYHRHRDGVYRLAWRFTQHHELALDVLQETFAHLLKKLPDFTLTAKLPTYLYPVVRHISIEMLRKHRRMINNESLPQEDAVVSVPPSETAEELAAVLSVLPDGQREVLLMRFIDGMTLQEIAAALAIPVGTVKSRLHNALEVLRKDRRTRQYFLNQ